MDPNSNMNSGLIQTSLTCGHLQKKSIPLTIAGNNYCFHVYFLRASNESSSDDQTPTETVKGIIEVVRNHQLEG